MRAACSKVELKNFAPQQTPFAEVNHYHHLVACSKSIAVSMMRCQEGQSNARRNAE